MCCGSRRSAWRAASLAASRAGPAVPQAAPAAPAAVGPGEGAAAARGPAAAAFPAVEIAYTEAAPVRVRGPVTGRAYSFSRAEPVQPVDARDAAVLIRNRAFRRTELAPA
jgi:hypothetical protein